MDADKRVELIKRNVVEIVSENELRDLLGKKKQPVVYCGYELSGPMHLGHFVTILKLMDFAKAGFKVKVLLADVHSFLNRKGSEADIKKQVENWKKTIKAIGLKAEIVLGSSFQFGSDYTMDVMKLAQGATINRGLRSMQEIARDFKNATISQLWYPLMQVVDIKYLKCDIAYGGIEQRKVHMIGRDMMNVLKHPFVAIHTPLITSLKGPGAKMSRSIPGTGISVLDSTDNIKKTINKSHCVAKEVRSNPVLEIAKLVIFQKFSKVDIKRDKKFGGNVSYKNYADLEKDFVSGKLHSMDLKAAVVDYIEKIVGPIRKKWK